MAKFDPKIHDRQSIRLKEYDYSQAGAYFVTIVTWHRECLFGEIQNGEMNLNQRGQIASKCWESITEHFHKVELGTYVIMPNHVHGIIVIHAENGTTANSPSFVGARHASPLREHPRGGSLGAIVGSFKSAVTKRIGRELNETGIWQRNYYEHIIRDEKDLKNKTDYVEANPVLWDQDDENPLRI